MKDSYKFLIVLGVVSIIIVGIVLLGKKSATSDNQQPTVDNSEVLKIRDNDNIRGDKNAPITIIDYSDYQCPFCVSYDKTIDQIMKAYPDQVKFVYRHLPLTSIHKNAQGAALAAEAAGAQGKYWEYHDILVANSQPDGKGLEAADLEKYAVDLGLNIDQFKQDLTNQDFINKIGQGNKDAESLKIQGTPASYLIGKDGKAETLSGAVAFDQMKAKIDAALAK